MLQSTRGDIFAGTRYSDDLFESAPLRYTFQPPVSVMGVTVFEQLGVGDYLVGSFLGLYRWAPTRGILVDHLSGQPWTGFASGRMPFGRNMVSGYFVDESGREAVFDYRTGLRGSADAVLGEMPQAVRSSRMSLWNLALEIHTGRIYGCLFGRSVLLWIPFAGSGMLVILFSGLVWWIRRVRGVRHGCDGARMW